MTNCLRRILILLAVVCIVSCDIPIKADHEPCDFIHTVNLTNSIKFENGSYLYDDILIPKNYVGTYNYIYDMKYEKISVTSHKRGCICLLKTCFRSCCDRNQTFKGGQCRDILSNYTSSTELLVSNQLVDAHGHEHFAFQQVQPCTEMFYYEPDIPMENWQLHKNGSFEAGSALKQQHQFCIVLQLNSTEYTLGAMSCFEDSIHPKILFKTYSMLFSLPFMLITIIIYLIIPELRTLHGKLLVCYLIGLLIGYSNLCYMNFYGDTLGQIECSTIGFVTYFCFVSSFLWLSVISFDLWWGFRKINVAYRLNERKRFLLYSLFAYGISLLILLFAIIMQFSKNVPDELKPGFDGDLKCFINIFATLPAFLYLYGLIIIVITINIILFILTAIIIYKVQKELAGVMAVKDNRRNLKSEHTNFVLFLRLFIIMGIIWTLEILCFSIERFPAMESLTYVLDFLNAIHGFVIFILFVVKGKVKKLLFKRFTNSSNESNKSSSTNTSISLQRLRSASSH